MPLREYSSADDEFRLCLPDGELSRMLRLCKSAKRRETGGLLVGRYSDDLRRAIVKTASDAPGDSRAGSTWFYRGVQGIQRWIDSLWNSDIYYLGEWHFHPFAAPDPSGTDIAQMEKIATTASYRCPEPILVIIGGDPSCGWKLRAFVFLRGRSYIELTERCHS